MICRLVFFFSICTVVVHANGLSLSQERRAESIAYFETHIRPVLVAACYRCHSAAAGTSEGGLLLDSRQGIQSGGDSGPAVVPGNPAGSLLLSRIAATAEDLRMPPVGEGEPLSQESIAAFRRWIEDGAVDPRDGVTIPPAKDMQAAAKHWAFQPLQKPAVPKSARQVGDDSTSQLYADEHLHRSLTPLDNLVFAKHRELGITANPPADRRTLLRRLSYDLTGLPPSYEAVVAFENDTSVDAYERRVESLLASPAYGQRWGRFWLDVARYADTKGYLPGGVQLRFPFSYTYRDYVIDAFNGDKPFEQFIVEQIAADHLELGQDRSPLAALGFLSLGRRFLNNQDDIIDDRIDVVARGMLGLTVACARCHDHKFDPIPTADYYSWHGVFASSREPDELPLLGTPTDPDRYARFLEARAEIEAKIQAKSDEIVDAFLQRHQAQEAEYRMAAVDYQASKKAADVDGFAAQRKLSPDLLRRQLAGVEEPLQPAREEVASWLRREIRNKTAALNRELEALSWTHDGAPRRAMALVDAEQPRDSHVLRRGKRGAQAELVPRQFLAALSPNGRRPFASGSGRLELAQSIAEHPLASRVFVNRVWGWHFGRPLVGTPSDFGVRTEAPPLVDALEWLTADFVEHGGSLKHLQRQIVLSAVYRQASSSNATAADIDRENETLHRFHRRRLEFEAMRDTLLAVSGTLDYRAGGLPVELGDTAQPARRTVYAYIDRQNLPGVFRTFDFPNPDATSPGRFRTTVPQQALYLMNSPFIGRQADALASQIADQPPAQAVVWLYQRLFQRQPTDLELEMGTSYIAQSEPLSRARYCQLLLLTNELTFID